MLSSTSSAKKRILVTGAVGQIGSDLVPLLRSLHGAENVVALFNRTAPTPELKDGGPHETADVSDKEKIRQIIEKYNINVVYHLASLLSATSEAKPDLAWQINLESLKHVLDLAKDYKLQVFWPSSIGAFGPTTPSENTPQHTILEPNTMYGVTKVSGELLCNYYHQRFGVDVRSLRYPGIISWKAEPGGGTTDYAVAIFYGALKKDHRYECYLRPDSMLPMMYMEDALQAAITLMDADASQVRVRTSYNLTAFSFSPAQLTSCIQQHIPQLQVTYNPDKVRQAISDSWPDSIDDSSARNDWGWAPSYSMERMVQDMIEKLSVKLGEAAHSQ